MFQISRDHKGLHVTRRADHLMYPHVLTTFKHAVDVFGFLVQHNERLTPLDWIERIESTYAASTRRDRTTAAIRAAMIDAPIAADESAPRRLSCACCGAVTRGRQWHNQDTGYGLCSTCADWITARHMQPEELERTYGKRGIHFDLPA